jgi:excisionase family DNA binding protein
MDNRRKEPRRKAERRRLPVEKMFTYREAADYAHVSVRTIIRWVKTGKLKAKYVFGRNPRISLISLKGTINRMPEVESGSKKYSNLLSSKRQEAGAEGGEDADQRPA